MEKLEITLCGSTWETRLDIVKLVYEGFFKPNLTSAELALIREQKKNPRNSSFSVDLLASDEQNKTKYRFGLRFEQVNRCRSSYTCFLNGDWRIYTRIREAKVGDVATFRWNYDDLGNRILSVWLDKKKVDEKLNLNICVSECKGSASFSKSGDEVCNINEWSTDEVMAAETLLMLKNGQANICVSECNGNASFSKIGDEVCNINECSTSELMAAETLLMLKNGQANVCVSECKEDVRLSKNGDEVCNAKEWSAEELMVAETLLLLKSGQANVVTDHKKGS